MGLKTLLLILAIAVVCVHGEEALERTCPTMNLIGQIEEKVMCSFTSMVTSIMESKYMCATKMLSYITSMSLCNGDHKVMESLKSSVCCIKKHAWNMMECFVKLSVRMMCLAVNTFKNHCSSKLLGEMGTMVGGHNCPIGSLLGNLLNSHSAGCGGGSTAYGGVGSTGCAGGGGGGIGGGLFRLNSLEGSTGGNSGVN